jgi:hypothetical protein
MYRIREENGEVRERRDQLRHPQYQKPELLATGANQVWSWDITKLLGPVKWTYFYLYVILDIFSRYVVGWMVAPRESAELAKRLIGETSGKQNIAPVPRRRRRRSPRRQNRRKRCSFEPALTLKSTSVLASKNARICSSLITSVACILMINTQHVRSLLQAHLV